MRGILDASSNESGLEIVWKENGIPDARGGHRSFFSWEMIRLMAKPRSPQMAYLNGSLARQHWDSPAQLLRSQYLRLKFDDIMALNGQPSPGMLLKVLEQLQINGIVLLEGVPTDSTADQSCTLRKIMGYIGEIRNTFYGETWDVKSMENSRNVAYTNLDLGLHMDLLQVTLLHRSQSAANTVTDTLRTRLASKRCTACETASKAVPRTLWTHSPQLMHSRRSYQRKPSF